MNEQLNFRKSAVIFMLFTMLFGGLTMSVFNEIHTNGLIFLVPYFIFIILGIGILRIDIQLKKSLSYRDSSSFLRSFLSFDSITSLFILAFISFCKVFLAIQILTFSLDYLFKILDPTHALTLKNSHLLIYICVICWMIMLYMQLFIDDSRLSWIKRIHYLIVFITLVLISFIIYKPEYFIEYITSFLTNISNENRFLLRPNTIWELKVWQNSAGKISILIILGNFLFKFWVKQKNNEKSFNNFGLISLSTGFFALGNLLVYLSPFVISRAYKLDEIPSNELKILIGLISILLSLIVVLINTLSNSLFDHIRKSGFKLNFIESKYLTKQNVLFVLTSLVGLFSGILFLFVGFKEYFYWIGMVFLLLLTITFFIHFIDNFSFNKTNKRFQMRNTENHLSSIDKLLLQIILPFFLLPVFLISLPDYFSNFLGNKQLTKKIEYLQDLGKITSNHHSLEPYIVRDYNKIILDIDSNKVQLDKIDSLKPIQKDSIQLYLENRNYKINETSRIEKLQFHHDIVFVKNFSKWSLIILIISLFLFYRFKLRDK